MENPVVQLLQNAALLALVVSLTRPVTLSSNLRHFSDPHLMFLIGMAVIWNRLLFRNRFPRISDAIERFGAAFIKVGFFRVVGSFLPPHLAWIPWFCTAFSVLPVIR
ncbi:hypothetical protein Acr_00g0067610 [Actinidia rufa]|uniref:Uncharacterized protein n=1 Tax=Actinidia rufa TaxID=165716 RepID=A0A7J0DQH5_9ERIC|nr:hypothetical protein Acr_00g0067610 [Actinidia rufa]